MADFAREYTVEMAVFVSTGGALLAAREARRINRKLEMVEDHDRAIHGDDQLGWPGLMPLVREHLWREDG